MKINEVIERHGMQLRDVSREMGMKPSALQSAIDRNLTVKTLRLISEAAKIPIAEFFLDELTEEEKQGILAVLQPAAPASQPADKMGAAHEVSTEGKQSPDDLPWEKTSTVAEELQAVEGRKMTAIGQQAIICPHCGHALVMNIASYEQK